MLNAEKDRLFQEEMETIKTRIMLNKLISINLTLFHEIRNYASTNNIPLRFSPAILRLVDEIEKTDTELTSSDGFSQRKSSDKDFTEPGSRLYASTTCQSRRRQLYRKVLN